MTDTDDIPDDIALAGEYVLGLLDGTAQVDVARRVAADPAFRAIVHSFEADFAGLLEDTDPVAPPTAIKSHVMAAVAPTTAPRRRLLGLFGALALAAVVVVAVLLPTLRTPPVAVPLFEAVLVSETSDLVVNAGFVPDDNLLIVARSQGAARPGRALELWLIAEGASAPVSLGVLSDAGETRLTVPADIAQAVPGGTLAVSDEPLGGSPTGAPTGDVLAAAAVTGI